MRICLLVLLAACGKEARKPPSHEPPRDAARLSALVADAAPVTADSYPDLATALRAIVPADARILGFGELHSRTDRAQTRSALSHFTTEALPAIGDQLSDLIVETWVVDPKCGQAAKTATAKVEITVRRPAETKSEIALLADAARKAKIQPHAMRIQCDDYDRIAPAGKDVQHEELLKLITGELARISGEAVRYRDKDPNKRPWIAVYGGALHNDRFPAKGVEDLSYARSADAATGDRFVEIDLIVPELAQADEAMQREPWYELARAANDKVQVWQRGLRSFVVILPRAK